MENRRHKTKYILKMSQNLLMFVTFLVFVFLLISIFIYFFFHFTCLPILRKRICRNTIVNKLLFCIGYFRVRKFMLTSTILNIILTFKTVFCIRHCKYIFCLSFFLYPLLLLIIYDRVILAQENAACIAQDNYILYAI